jgi:cytochrome P450
MDEALRHEPPVDFTWRIAARDRDLSGGPVKAGSALNLFIRSANRDEAAFTNAYQFAVTRPRAARHLAFGGGAHICPGAPLARMEARHLLSRLFDRFPNLRRSDSDTPPQWRRLPRFRGLEWLMVSASKFQHLCRRAPQRGTASCDATDASFSEPSRERSVYTSHRAIPPT